MDILKVISIYRKDYKWNTQNARAHMILKTNWRQLNIGSIYDLGPPLLTWFIFNHSMDK